MSQEFPKRGDIVKPANASEEEVKRYFNAVSNWRPGRVEDHADSGSADGDKGSDS